MERGRYHSPNIFRHRLSRLAVSVHQVHLYAIPNRQGAVASKHEHNLVDVLHLSRDARTLDSNVLVGGRRQQLQTDG